MPNAPLSVGAYGPSVARLQTLLCQQGFSLPGSEVNRSFFGPLTRQAVQEFQKKVRLPVTGEVDEQTDSVMGALAPTRVRDVTIAEPPTVQPVRPDGATTAATQPVVGQTNVAAPSESGKAESGTHVESGRYLRVTLPVAKLSDLAGTLPDKSVWENLHNNTPAKSFLTNALITALKGILADTLNNAKKFTLAGLAEKITAPDLVSNNSLSVKAFIQKSVGRILGNQPNLKQAVDAEIENLSDATTVRDLLQLDTALQDHPFLRPYGKKATIALLLATSPHLGRNLQLQEDFIDRYSASKGSIQDFWNQLSSDPKFKALVPELQLTLQLGTLALANPPLVAALRAKYPNIKTTVQLTSLTSAQWQDLIANPNVTIPASIQGSTPAEKASNYETSIATTLKKAFPGAYFGSGLQALIANSTDPVDKGLATFLTNASDFDLLNGNLNTYLAQNNQTALKGIDPNVQGAVTSKAAAWQRVGRVVSDLPTANALFLAGYTSAYAIASTPRANFLQAFAGAMGGSQQAATIYGRAQQIASSAMTLFSNVRQALTTRLPRAIGDVSGQLSQSLSSTSSKIPNWQDLFGSLSYCSCTDCRSVYSAAAYFVDLLQFLRNSKPRVGYLPFDVLIGSSDLPGRRPDLPYLKLNCENINTTLPYVDLVNEILEGFVVLNSGKLDSSVAHNTPRNATASDLSVTPEYTRADAYNTYLSSAIYPPSLPFDRWLTTARTYLNFMGSSLYTLMSACQTGADASHFTAGTPSGIAIACEYLGISQEECIILTGKDFSGVSQPSSPPPLYEYYGYMTQKTGNTVTFVPPLPAGTTWEEDLSGMGNTVGVENFLQRAAITYDDLVALLKTRALNPNLTIMLEAPDGADACNLTKTTIVDLSAPSPLPFPFNPASGASPIRPVPPQPQQGLQDTPTLSLMHRFIRLWKKLGWTIEELDKTMTALKATDIDQQFIVSLSAVKQFQAALGIPLLQVLSFWADLDTDGRNSLYLTLFQNQTMLNPQSGAALNTPDPAFQLDYSAPLPSIPTLDFPSPLFPNLVYDATSQLLSISQGEMTLGEVKRLQQLSNDPSFTSAIDTLLHLEELVLELGFSPVGLSVPLAKLPTAVLPNDVVFYDAANNLIYRTGLMSDDDRAQLNFSNDPLYQTAIDALYEARTLWGTEITHPLGPQLPHLGTNAILAALRITSQDLNLIRQYTGLVDTPLHPASLTLANLSTVSRYAFLAQGLGLSVNDFLILIALVGVDPFHQQSPIGTLTFVQTVQSVQASNFSVAQLNYIYRHVYDPNAGTAPLPANVDLLLSTLQSGLAGIANANVLVPDPKGDLLVKNLAKLLGNALANAALGLLNGTGVYSSPLAAMPTISLPAAILSYDAAAGQLSMAPSVAMTATQLSQLLALSPDPDYQSAINDLYAASNRPVYSVSLASLPAITLPNFVNYNASAQQLSMASNVPMTAAEETQLLGLSTDVNYQTAVASLYAESQPPSYSVPLAQLPDLLSLFLDTPVAYDAVNHQLILTTPIYPDQAAQLANLSNDATYQTALTTLLNESAVAGSAGPYTAPLASLPPWLVLPSQLKGLVNYDSTQGLQFTGPMTSAEEGILETLSNDPAYQAAVASLHKQPIDFIYTNFSAFLDPNDAITQLIDNPQPVTTAQKALYVAQKLMPYLQQIESESLITQTLSDNLQIDPELCSSLLKTVLNSQINPGNQNAHGIDDFLALAGDGLSVTYYSNETLTGAPVLTRIDTTINFDWVFGFPDPSLTTHPFSAEWTGWVMPQYSETYTFYVRNGDGIRLWVNGQQLLNSWTDKPSAEVSFAIPLTAGQLYPIKLDYYDNTASGVISLSWSSPSTPKAVIPQWQLFSGTSLKSLTPIINSYTLLYKTALLASTFRLTTADVSYFYDHPDDFAGSDPADPSNPGKFVPFDPKLLPLDPSQFKPAMFSQWQRLNAVVNLRNNLPGGDAGLLNIFTLASAKPQPTSPPPLSQVAGGTLSGATYYVQVTYSTIGGETLPSNESTLAVASGQLLQIASPPVAPGAIGWNAYLSTSAGSETRQNSTPIPIGTAWTEPVSGLVAGAAPPTPNPAVLQANVNQAVFQTTGWNPADFSFLEGASGFRLGYADFANERGTNGVGLVRLQTCFRLLSRLGINAQQLLAWSQPPDPTNEQTNAADIQSTLKARYDANTWVTVGKPLNDTIREASKEALIAYILAHAGIWQLTTSGLPRKGDPVTSSDQLYELFLIDVDMSPCMLTSRIVQANAAIQLFVQRCLMNLEPGVSPSSIDPTEWSWMQNFRVWQAARQVFLYPENWMVPTLRDDKTPFFEDLENTLLQNPIRNETAEQAYLDYLTALNEVSQLDMRATYWQLDANSTTASDGTSDRTNDVLHVFGRTTSQPYKYYYRRLLNCSQYGQAGGGTIWTPWELVDLDIAIEPVSPTTSVVGDHLMPVVWDGRLYLFWPIFKETADSSSQTAPQPVSPGQSLPQPVKDLSITLAWSEYRQGAWSPKQTSPNAWVISNYSVFVNSSLLDTSLFNFTTSFSGDDSLVVTILFSPFDDEGPYTLGGYFTFSRCGGVPNPSNPFVALQTFYVNHAGLPPELFMSSPFGSSLKYNLLTNIQLSLQVPVGLVPTASTNFQGNTYFVEMPTVLGNMPSRPWQLLFPHQFLPSFGLLTAPPDTNQPFPDQPFFVQDSQRAYFVTESLTNASQSFGNESLEYPLYSRSSLSAPVPAVDNKLLFTLPTLATATGCRSSAPVARLNPATAVSDMAPGGESANTLRLSQILFSTFFHPFSCFFLKTINKYGIPGLLTLRNQAQTNDSGVISGFLLNYTPPTFTLSPGVLMAQGQLYEAIGTTALPAPLQPISWLYFNPSKRFYWTVPGPGVSGDAFLGIAVEIPGWNTYFVNGPTVFESQYQPDSTHISRDTYPRERVDFDTAGAYSIYNWELFFQIPLLIATSLSQNQQFADAQKWFHYIFNPTSNSVDPIPQRYWNCLPFYECSPWDQVEGQIQNLLYPSNSGSTGTPPSLCGQDINDQISQWKKNPFEPFLIGRMRSVAFRMKVVMAYLDNLIAWGDSLFAQNTRESINEATQIYVLAKEILGDRTVQIPQRGTIQDYTYNDLVQLFGVDEFSNTLVVMENNFPNLTASSAPATAGLSAAVSMSSHALYFCVPPNTNLLSYWDTVDDRLYKIRHCMNIQGQVEQLPLFAPPISPALLVAAAAAGVDLSSVLSNTNAGTPFHRFNVMVQKALELCAEVRSFGAALLSALEKKDAEALALLRATQETSLLQAMQQLKQAAVDAAQQDVAALQASLQVATDRQNYYNGLIQAGLIAEENQQMSSLSDSDHNLSLALPFQMTAAGLGSVPGTMAGSAGTWSTPVLVTYWGTEVVVAAASALGTYFNIQASESSTEASQAGLNAEWKRRSAEWGFQYQSATDEIAQINAQISAANLRLKMAQEDQSNLDFQIQNAQAAQDFLRGKFTNTQLYTWMVDQTSKVFSQCYQMAYDLATRAEAAFRFERGLATSSYIQFGYWDSLKKGLLSGEQLYADLKRMEIAHLETDVREFEISKSISLVLFDPWALIALKETGLCTISLPEAYFDMDYPGHYFRRLKTVSLMIPCVTGPYTSVNCTLTLLNSKVRVDSNANSSADYASDAHFITNYAATQSIATSTAQNDSGLFEVNFQDPRYLPFEGAGVISTWQIELPPDCNAFDFETISDVVLNIKYTCRYGGDNLRTIAQQARTLPTPPAQPGSPSSPPAFPGQSDLRRLFSLKHEFSSEWYKFLNPPQTAPDQSMQIALTIERFPYQYRGMKLTITSVDLFLKFKDIHDKTFNSGTPLGDYASGSPLKVYIGSTVTLPPPPNLPPPNATLTSAPTLLTGLPFASVNVSGGQLGAWTLEVQNDYIKTIAGSLQNSVTIGNIPYNHLNPAVIDDIVMVCHYSAKP
jgi:hypothetical protein